MALQQCECLNLIFTAALRSIVSCCQDYVNEDHRTGLSQGNKTNRDVLTLRHPVPEFF